MIAVQSRAMPTAIDQLPDDVEQLKQLVIALGAQLAAQEQRTAEKQAELAAERNEVIAARLLIEKLKLQIARYRRMQYGRKSERHDAHVAQLELIVEELESSLAAGAEQPSGLAPAGDAASARSKPARRPLPDHLPRETQEHAAACACSECGGELKRIGEDVAEQLEFIPEHFKVIRHVRPKFACGKCQSIVQAAAPSRPIDKGVAGPGLLAHVAVSKYIDHLPLYRQSEIYARQGVDLERSTLAGWIAGVAELVSPLVEAIGRYVTAATKLHADDTTVPVLDPGRGKTKTGRLWVYVRDDRPAGSKEPAAALYRYSPTREGLHPAKHLKAFQGTLQADGYSGFDALFERGPIGLAACWAHARRKFYDLHAATKSPLAAEALERIGALYKIEGEIRGKPPDERRHVRQARAAPLIKDLHDWLQQRLTQVSAKSDAAGDHPVLTQALGRADALSGRRSDRDR
jgi:transposase